MKKTVSENNKFLLQSGPVHVVVDESLIEAEKNRGMSKPSASIGTGELRFSDPDLHAQNPRVSLFIDSNDNGRFNFIRLEVKFPEILKNDKDKKEIKEIMSRYGVSSTLFYNTLTCKLDTNRQVSFEPTNKKMDESFKKVIKPYLPFFEELRVLVEQKMQQQAQREKLEYQQHELQKQQKLDEALALQQRLQDALAVTPNPVIERDWTTAQQVQQELAANKRG